jgi:hypothetical protein
MHLSTSYAFGSANLHEQSLRDLTQGSESKSLLSRRGNRGMVALDEFWPRCIGAIRSITTDPADFAACHCSPHCFMTLSARVVAAVPSKIAAASTD